MPRISEFVPINAPPGGIPATAVTVEPSPALDLTGGTLAETTAELQSEINENAEAADLAVLLFENSLL